MKKSKYSCFGRRNEASGHKHTTVASVYKNNRVKWLFDEGDDKMIKTEAFPTIRMKIDRLLKITNEYQFNDLVKAAYCINLCINNRSVLESCLALNACLIEYEEKGSKRIGTYDEFKGFLSML